MISKQSCLLAHLYFHTTSTITNSITSNSSPLSWNNDPDGTRQEGEGRPCEQVAQVLMGGVKR